MCQPLGQRRRLHACTRSSSRADPHKIRSSSKTATSHMAAQPSTVPGSGPSCGIYTCKGGVLQRLSALRTLPELHTVELAAPPSVGTWPCTARAQRAQVQYASRRRRARGAVAAWLEGLCPDPRGSSGLAVK